MESCTLDLAVGRIPVASKYTDNDLPVFTEIQTQILIRSKKIHRASCKILKNLWKTAWLGGTAQT